MDTSHSNPKNPQYSCVECEFITGNKKDYSRHLLTNKHLHTVKYSDEYLHLPKYICNCGKKYKHRQSLNTHKKICNYEEENHVINKEESKQVVDCSNNNIILELLKSNNDFKELIIEQNKQMMELMKEMGTGNTNNTTTNSNNTTNNNKFNLNLFLNEQCKDAMNISDFIKSIEISIKEFEDVGKLGYCEGISNILVNNLKLLEVFKRPIHCSDAKRETMYIKDKDEWENDKEKALFTTAIRQVSHKNFLKSFDWKKDNPDYRDSTSNTMDKFNKIIYESMGPQTVEEKDKDYNKILRKVAKEVIIDK